MPQSLPKPSVTTLDKPLVAPRPQQAKAELRGQAPTPRLSPLVSEAIRTVHGKQELAAEALGKDPGNFNRDMKRIAEQLEALGPETLAEIGAQLTRAYGPLAQTPAARVRTLAHCLREIEEELYQLASYIGEVA